MKKALLLLSCAALLLAGCQKDQITPGVSDGSQVTVTFTTNLVSDATKAVADRDGAAAKVNHWVLQVLAQDDLFYEEERDVTAGTLQQTYELKLFKNQSYTLLFWADTKGAYNTENLKAVSKSGFTANADSLDAFSANVDYTSLVSESKSVPLYRPFAQLNIITCDLDELKAKVVPGTYAKYAPAELKVVATVPTTFNVQTQTAGTAASQTLTAAASYADFSAGTPETTLFMDYIFAFKENADVIPIDFSFKSNGQDVTYNFTNIPLQRNYRTNIKGQLMSYDSHWTVTIDPQWNTPEYVEEQWAAGMVTPVTPVEDVYTINLPSELAWIAQQVNAGNTFAGKTVKLAKDIDLNNGAWTPMGGVSSYPSVAFHGTLDGNNHKILNLNCSDNTKNYAAAALIGGGHCTVKDLTIENVKVSSTHYAAALVAYCGDGGLVLTNCKVKNGSITSTPEWLGTGYDNGDKVGGILGYGANACKISGCSVEGLAIKAYRDLGGIAGAAQCSDIKSNSVKNCTVTADQTVNFYDISAVNAGAIVGRSLEGTVDESNTAENVTVNCTLADGLSFNPETKKLVVSSAKGLDALRNNLSPDYKNRVISVVPGDGVQSNLYCIELANDITLTDVWTTISLAADQSIELNGNDNTISGLTVSGQEYAGLFTSRTEYYNSFTAKDLTISGAQITGTSVASDVKDDYAGAFLACAGKRATLTNCSVVNSTVSNAKRMGAMMGMNNGPESVEFSNLTVSGCTITGVYDATGGVFGHMQTYANVLYTNVVVTETTITVPSGKTYGGIVGRVGAEGETYTFKNCAYNGESTKEALCGQVLNGSQVVIQND